MSFITSLCLILVLALAAESSAETSFKDNIFAKFDGTYDVEPEKGEVEGFEYTLHNFTFPASSEDGHKRVKRLGENVNSAVQHRLCIMTFNIRTYTDSGLVNKDTIIAHVSFTEFLLAIAI